MRADHDDMVDQLPHVPLVIWCRQAHLLGSHVSEHLEEDPMRLPELVKGLTSRLLLVDH
jgi:hypothetical protein